MSATTTSMPTISVDDDSTAIAARIAALLEQAWNRADGHGFGAAFTEDAEFVDIRGDHHRGRLAIGFGHQAILETIYAGSTVRYEVDVARRIAPGVLVAVVSATLDAPTGPLAGVNHSRFTMTVVEQGGAWLVAAFQNTLVASR